MKILLTTLLATAVYSTVVNAAEESKGVEYPAVITRVIDGDTVAIQATWLPDPLKKEISVRVFGVDTPEKGFRAKCAEEASKGAQASQFTKDAVASATSTKFVLIKWDKYGGRVLGDIILDGQSLRSMLLAKGYARAYFGDTKLSWCTSK